MKRTLTILTLQLLICLPIFAADTLKVPYDPMWYAKRYPFITYKGNIFAFESEFLFPDGFRRLEEKKLTPYQFWVSNFPLWNAERGVASLARGPVLQPEQISRSVHMQWRSTKFYDCFIPLQMLAEYMLSKDRPFDLTYLSRTDQPLTYRQFLDSRITYDAMGNVYFTPDEKRKPNDTLFNHFLDLVAFNTNYLTLEKSCEPIPDSSILPGDLLIGRDSLGLAGKVYVVMLVVANKAGERKYIVATGCADGCDLYIPLVKDDRRYPWLDLAEVKALVKTPLAGFFRLRVPGERH